MSDTQQLNQLGDLQEKIAIGVVGVAVVRLHHIHQHFLQPAGRWFGRENNGCERRAMYEMADFTGFTPPFW